MYRSKTMKPVGAAASSVDAYMYVRLCTHIMLYCMCIVYVLCIVRTTKSILGLQNCKTHYENIYIFENELLPTAAIRQGQHLDAVRCRTLFSGLISMFVFDILQILSRCIKFCSERTGHNCTPMATSLSCI
jgi:hypothetical protein